MNRRRGGLGLGVLCGIGLLGCEPPAGSGSGGTSTAPEDVQPSPRAAENGVFDASATDALATAMDAAMEQGRATLPDAQARWADQSPVMQERWSVKWAWPAVGGGTEYVWVTPVRWTAFRIEGTLTNAPVDEHDPPHEQGDLVSFPVSEAVDWVHWPTGDVSGSFEGGFTIEAFRAYERGALGGPASGGSPE